MAQYELMLILDPNVWQEDRDASLKNIKKELKKHKIKVEKEDVWGERKLAYKINSSEKWVYVLFDLEFDWKAVSEVSQTINLDRVVWRYMFVKKEF